MSTKVRATIEDLYTLPDKAKAEIVDGEIVLMSPTGEMPGRAGGSIYVSLRQHEGKTRGRAYPDNVGFRVNLPNRESFSPDVAWYTGPSRGMKFAEGAFVFAVEVRSEYDGPIAEQLMAAKRSDYFAAGTLVVWDVDLLGTDVIKCYDANNPDNPRIFRRGDVADPNPPCPDGVFRLTNYSVSGSASIEDKTKSVNPSQ
ncbi:MAG TPA: Uma2 family endonuclease [Blastocatellia bacterium]|nr:Uma2 family endonuclease [Blastocatellia bacterium]